MSEYRISANDLKKAVMRHCAIPSISLQKYYSMNSFIRSLTNNKFTFQKPSTWEDPFEDFISKLVNNSESAKVNNISITSDIYAMSTISKLSECNGMWENFAKRNGVLIRTSSDRIIQSFINYLLKNDLFSDKKVYENNHDIKSVLFSSLRLKKIEYLNDDKIAEFFKKSTNKNDINYNEFMFDSLSKKRIEYEYENEYRFFIVPSLLKIEEARYLEIGDFKESLIKVVISPHLTSDEYEEKAEYFVEKFNIEKSIIEQSKLYDIDHFKSKYKL